MHPAHHGLGTPAGAQGDLRGADLLSDVEQGERPLAGAGMGGAERQATQVCWRLVPARKVNT